MVHRNEVIGLMVAALPEYLGSEHAGRAEEDDGAFIHMATVVSYVLERLGLGDAQPLDAIAAVAEQVLRDGDAGARNLIEVGFIEDLTNRNLWPDGIGPADIRQHLGPLVLHTRWGLQLLLEADD